MEVIEAIKSRKSIRGYESTPVSKEILTQILEISTRSPSGMNIQPWQFTIVGGKLLDEMKTALEERYLAGEEMRLDFGQFAARLTGVYRERQVTLAKDIFQLMDIDREDKGKRMEWTLKMLRFFDAPNGIIISTDEEVSDFMCVYSLGLITQTIALAALEYGLGTCIEQDPVMYPKVIRQFTGIPESQKIAMAIAIGYPDWNFPANKLQSTREPISNITTWHGI